AVADERFPAGRPGKVADQFTGKRKRQVEAADPGTRPPQESLEFREGLEAIDALQRQRILRQDPDRDRDRLRLARRAGEVDAVDPQCVAVTGGALRIVCSTTQ